MKITRMHTKILQMFGLSWIISEYYMEGFLRNYTWAGHFARGRDVGDVILYKPLSTPAFIKAGFLEVEWPDARAHVFDRRRCIWWT